MPPAELGAAKGTALRLLGDIGRVCAAYQDVTLRSLACRRVQCDEVWAFVRAKEKNVPSDMRGKYGLGDTWTWVALDADTKSAICWLVGKRDATYAHAFFQTLVSRLAHRVQLTTDGHRAHVEAVENSFGSEVDYAMPRENLRGRARRRNY